MRTTSLRKLKFLQVTTYVRIFNTILQQLFNKFRNKGLHLTLLKHLSCSSFKQGLSESVIQIDIAEFKIIFIIAVDCVKVIVKPLSLGSYLIFSLTPKVTGNPVKILDPKSRAIFQQRLNLNFFDLLRNSLTHCFFVP